MGDRIDIEGLGVALTVWEGGQQQLDELKTKSREATSARLFWRAITEGAARLQPRRPEQ